MTQVEWEFTESTVFLFDPYRYKVGWGGRGGVKSWSFARALLIQGYERPLRVLCTREVQKSIKDSVHQLLADQIELLGLSGFYEVLQSEIRGRNGTKFIFSGLSNLTAESIKSFEGVDRVWVEEARNVSKRSWDILVPTIRKDDSEIWVTFNPELDTDETYVRFVESSPKNAHVAYLSYTQNPWFPKVLEDERQEFLRQVANGTREQHEYDNVWLGHCKPAVEGAIYTRQIELMAKEQRYKSLSHNPALFTHVIWDLGYNGMSIGFVQRAANDVSIIDHLYLVGYTYEECVREIRAKVAEHGYRIAIDGKTGGKAWLPHDGKQTRPDKGKSPIRQLNDLGLVTDKEGIPDLGIDKRIEAGRQMFARTWINQDKCTDLYNSLRRYSRKIMPETGQVGGIKKDGHDHDGDMFTYIAVIEKELTNESNQKLPPIKYSNRGIV